MTNDEFTIYSKPQYYDDLIARLNNAGKGDLVALATMNFEPLDKGMPELIDALCATAKRGASVRLAVDAYNYLVNGKTKLVGPLWYLKTLPKHLPPYYRKKFEALERIKASGVRLTITNQPAKAFSQPFGGRSHIKYTIIKNYVFLGGCNLTSRDDIDLMVGWQHATTAAWLLEFADKVDKAGSVRQALDKKDVSFDVDLQTDLLVDAGIAHQSLIYEKALELIDQAENFVFITCQMFPNSRTIEHLKQANDRGAKVTILYNSPMRHGLHSPIHQVITWRENVHLPESIHKSQMSLKRNYLHAKLIATEKAAIIGSHNYLPSGVNFGTAEIALLRRDPAFALQAVEAIKTQLA